MNLIARYLDYLLKQFGPTAIFGKLQWTKIQNQEKVLALIFFFSPVFQSQVRWTCLACIIQTARQLVWAMSVKCGPFPTTKSLCIVLRKIYDSTDFNMAHPYYIGILSQRTHITQRNLHSTQYTPPHITQYTCIIQAYCSSGMIYKSLSMNA